MTLIREGRDSTAQREQSLERNLLETYKRLRARLRNSEGLPVRIDGTYPPNQVPGQIAHFNLGTICEKPLRTSSVSPSMGGRR